MRFRWFQLVVSLLQRAIPTGLLSFTFFRNKVFAFTGGVGDVEDGEVASAVTAVTAGDAHATTAEATLSGAEVSKCRVPRTDPATTASWIEEADEQFRSEQVAVENNWIDHLEILIPDNIIENLHKLASHLPRERAWVIEYLTTSRKATALAVNHLKSLGAGTSNANWQQVDAISSVTAEQQATSEYLILSRKATQLALQSLQDQNILDENMQISDFFAKSRESLNHDISASGDHSNEHLTASPRTPERIISKGGAKARATAPTSLLKLKQGCTVPEHQPRAAGYPSPRSSASSRPRPSLAPHRCADSASWPSPYYASLNRRGFIYRLAAIIIMKGLLKLTVHTAITIAYILRIAIVDAPPAIREFMHDVIEEAHALEEARSH
ncbi:hypothetical protein LTR95_010598 [Oleoguttula sp. CCFEE 5521]